VRSEVRANSRLFRALSRTLLEQGIGVRFRAQGRSMFPAVANGDVLEVHPSTTQQPGDVILIESIDGLRAHRIVSANSEQIVTQGDSCHEPDRPASSDSILGRVAVVVTATGRRAPHTLRTRLRQMLSRFR
jgi:hypothetical protein